MGSKLVHSFVLFCCVSCFVCEVLLDQRGVGRSGDGVVFFLVMACH